MDKISLKIGFGVLLDPFDVQLREQGFAFSAKTVAEFEKSRERITHLRFDGLLSDKELDSIQKKLFNKIKRHVISKNKKMLNGQAS